MSANRKFLRRVTDRRIQTYATVSELLECGHRNEVLPTADPLTAKHRLCDTCARLVALPPKIQPSPARRNPNHIFTRMRAEDWPGKKAA